MDRFYELEISQLQPTKQWMLDQFEILHSWNHRPLLHYHF